MKKGLPQTHVEVAFRLNLECDAPVIASNTVIEKLRSRTARLPAISAETRSVARMRAFAVVCSDCL